MVGREVRKKFGKGKRARVKRNHRGGERGQSRGIGEGGERGMWKWEFLKEQAKTEKNIRGLREGVKKSWEKLFWKHGRSTLNNL